MQTSTRSRAPVVGRGLAALVALASLTLLAACGSDNAAAEDVATLQDGASTTATSDADSAGGVSDEERQEAMLDFAACMRQQGIDMPDPQFEGNGRVQAGGIRIGGEGGIDPDEFEAAQEQCGQYLEKVRSSFGVDDPEQRAKMQEQLLDFSQCMRDHGIDMPDPQFGEDGSATIAMGPGARGVDPDDPDFQAAEEACRGDGDGGPFFRPERREDGGSSDEPNDKSGASSEDDR